MSSNLIEYHILNSVAFRKWVKCGNCDYDDDVLVGDRRGINFQVYFSF